MSDDDDTLSQDQLPLRERLQLLPPPQPRRENIDLAIHWLEENDRLPSSKGDDPEEVKTYYLLASVRNKKAYINDKRRKPLLQLYEEKKHRADQSSPLQTAIRWLKNNEFFPRLHKNGGSRVQKCVYRTIKNVQVPGKYNQSNPLVRQLLQLAARYPEPQHTLSGKTNPLNGLYNWLCDNQRLPETEDDQPFVDQLAELDPEEAEGNYLLPHILRLVEKYESRKEGRAMMMEKERNKENEEDD